MADTTKIIGCNCAHPWQDQQYGLGMRVHNYAAKAHAGNPGWRCTVCGKVVGASANEASSNSLKSK